MDVTQTPVTLLMNYRDAWFMVGYATAKLEECDRDNDAWEALNSDIARRRPRIDQYEQAIRARMEGIDGRQDGGNSAEVQADGPSLVQGWWGHGAK